MIQTKYCKNSNCGNRKMQKEMKVNKGWCKKPT